MPKYFFIFLILSHLTWGQSDVKVYKSVEIQPEPIGGNIEFLNYISKNLKIPPKLSESDTFKTVFSSCYRNIHFIVEKNGKLTFVSNGKCATKEGELIIKDLIENAPKWTPAKHKGKTVRYQQIVFISCIMFD